VAVGGAGEGGCVILILSRTEGEAILLEMGGEAAVVVVTKHATGGAKLGIAGDRERVRVTRVELLDDDQRRALGPLLREAGLR
jgi:sRNA-binding carbon storage regulator CsrA